MPEKQKANKILWEKWINPLDAPQLQPGADEEADEEFLEFSGEFSNTNNPFAKTPVIIGPMGIIPVGDNNNIGKIFNFWIMHTNFNISEVVLNTLQAIDGVESIDTQTMTRYRVRLAFGRLFDAMEVKREIEETLCKKQDTRNINDLIETTANYLSSRYKFWAVLRTKDGQLSTLYDNKDKEGVDLLVSECVNLHNMEVVRRSN